MARIPYNIEFCQFKECKNLKDDSKCKKNKCPYNVKWVVYWTEYGVYPPSQGD